MVKFIVIDKSKIIKCFILILLTIFLCSMFFIFFFKEKTISSFISSSIHNNTEKDFDGDGSIDSLIIDKKNNHYIVKIKTSKNEYTLKNDVLGDALIDLYDSVAIKINTIDLSRDGLPEIILSGYKNASPITYIFKWLNDDFKEVFSTQKNICGVLDSSNSRTPKILYTLSDKGDEATEAFIFNGTSTKDISFSKPHIPSLDVIQKFIDLIQLDYEIAETPDLFTAYINSDELGILWTLNKETYRYSFQNGYFYDINWDKNGLPASIIWSLSFEKVNSTDSSKLKEELFFSIKTDINEFREYKISSIKKYN